MDGVYLVFVGCYLVSLPFIRWLPARPARENNPDLRKGGRAADGERRRADGRPVPAILPWFSLAAIFFTYINIGAYWTYIELAALHAGIAEAWIVPLLTWVSLGSVVGCLVAMLVSDRFGLARPLLLALGGMILIVGLLADAIDHRNLLISLVFFNLLWAFIDVYQMSTAAVIDRSGARGHILGSADADQDPARAQADDALERGLASAETPGNWTEFSRTGTRRREQIISPFLSGEKVGKEPANEGPLPREKTDGLPAKARYRWASRFLWMASFSSLCCSSSVKPKSFPARLSASA